MNDVNFYKGRDFTQLLSYQRTLVVYYGTFRFVKRFLEKGDRTRDQMIQAARSGKQNIIEGAKASAGSKADELFLTNVALSSLAELKEDYSDYLHTRNLRIWDKDSAEAKYVRGLCRKNGGCYEVYRAFIETRSDEVVANILLTVINQAEVLLTRQIKALAEKFLREGGVRENMMKMRKAAREPQKNIGENTGKNNNGHKKE